jgi:hypothetical protein
MSATNNEQANSEHSEHAQRVEHEWSTKTILEHERSDIARVC